MGSVKLGAFMKTMRKRFHLSQQELADQLGIQRQSYSHYETGRNTPPMDILSHLAKMYHISVEAFTQISDDPKLLNEHPNIILQEEDGSYLIYNSDKDALKYINLSDSESDLINHFRLLDERDQNDVIEITKLKVRLNGNQQ